MNIVKRMWIGWLFLLVHVYGQSNVFTLQQLVNSALKNDEQSQIYFLEQNKTHAQKKQLQATYLPEINILSGYNHQSEIATIQLPFVPGQSIEAGVYDQYDFSIQLKELLFDGFSRLYRGKQIQTRMQEVRYQQEYRKNEIRFYVFQLVYQYKAARLSRKALKSSLQRLKLQKGKIMALFNQGFASRLDTLEIVSRIHEVEMQLLSLESSAKNYLIELEQLCGITPIDSILFEENFGKKEEKSQNVYIEAIPYNYQLSLLKFQEEKLRYQIKSNRSSYFPRIAMQFSYHYGKPGVNFFQNKWMDYWTFGVQFSWNIWRWGRDRQNIRISQYNLQQLHLKQKLMEKHIEANLRKYWQKIDELQKKKLQFMQMVQEKKEKYELIRAQWEKGQKTTLDVLDAEQELTSTELQTSVNTIQIHIIQLLLDREVGFRVQRYNKN